MSRGRYFVPKRMPNMNKKQYTLVPVKENQPLDAAMVKNVIKKLKEAVLFNGLSEESKLDRHFISSIATHFDVHGSLTRAQILRLNEMTALYYQGPKESQKWSQTLFAKIRPPKFLARLRSFRKTQGSPNEGGYF